ncbi:hypothetical protein [Streptomyces longwoodensis]|uniref:hypothetical protein n=1 Tax=Streptomyces longwoodensis TaxID=68231 RepID=UPI0036F5948A
MSNRNANAVKFIRFVGQTPGYAMEPGERGRYKLIRLAVDEYGVDRDSITVSANAADQQHQNDVTRAKNKLGWTYALYTELEEIARECRLKEEDPKEPQLRCLLAHWGIDPDAKPSQQDTDQHSQPVRRRHGKGGTATGSAKVKAGEAQSAGSAAAPEAPVQLLDNVGRMQPEMISPERALDLLTRMAPYQRKLDPAKVRDYAEAMRRGEWKLNPADPLCIDTNGQTANGQHRLNACVEAEVPIPCWVAYDTPPDTYDVMDRGKKRTTGDMLFGAGEVNANRLASLASFAHLWFNYDQDQWASAPKVTEAQVFAMVENHPHLRESAKYGVMAKLSISTQATMLAHYLISRKLGFDHRLVTTWYKRIQVMDLTRGEPGHTLGLYYMNAATRRRKPLTGRAKRDLDMYLVLQAWNNTCLGKEVRSIGYDNNFTIPDPLAPKDGVHTFPPIA